MNYYHIDENQVILSEDYCDFNGNKYLSTRKRKLNKKYYVYSKETSTPIILDNMTSMQIIDIINFEHFKIVFYTDSGNHLSFIKTIHKEDTNEARLIHEIERTPQFVTSLFGFLKKIYIFGIIRFNANDLKEIDFVLGYNRSISAEIKFLFPESIRQKYASQTFKPYLLLHLFWCKIPFKKLYQHYFDSSEINLPIYIRMITAKHTFLYNLKMRSRDRYTKRHYIYNTRNYRLKNSPVEFFIRKSVTGQFVFVFTTVLSNWIKIVEKAAYITALFSLNKNKYNVYFEKFCEGASESAFVLFEYAQEYDKHAVYILDPNNEDYDAIKEKHGKKLLKKNSFRALYAIFLAKSFISSDLVSHIQRRLYDNDSLIKKKILYNRKKIFLQHGVCLATNVFERGYYNRKVPIAPDYIVVSSNYEKELFLSYTNYRDNNFIESGLPNMDLYAQGRNENKSDITFLLTWRPWDLTGTIEEGSYISRYKQFIQLISTESFYQNKKVNIILHPKAKLILKEQFPEFYQENEALFYNHDIKDALLQSKVLISDYSSVVFFGFSGGSNIVFYWEDKERAEEEYGSPNILQKDISFGDIAYKFAELDQLIKKNYKIPQPENYKKIYDQLVEYKNGDNTEKAYRHIYSNILAG